MVAFDEAEGRIAAESLAAYPPGVPNVLPGERLTRPTLDYIADSVAHGGLVRGAQRPHAEDDPGRERHDRAPGAPTPRRARLRDVLLGPPENFRWLPTSAISKATLESGASFDSRARRAPSIASWSRSTSPRASSSTSSSPTRRFPTRCFARDSSVMTPDGAVVTQLKQQWRRGEYAPVIRFYQESEIPIRG